MPSVPQVFPQIEGGVHTYRCCSALDLASLRHERLIRCRLDELYTALTWGANELSRRGLGFRAGQVISTGSPHEPVAAVPGAEAVVRYGDVGEIRVTFES